MKKIIIFLCLIFIVSTIDLFAQNKPNPLDFFPHHTGDIFEYTYTSTSNYFQNIIKKDSLGSDGKFYLETSYFGNIRIDTLNFEWYNNQWGGPEYSTLLFKLNADSGDTWIAWQNEVDTIKAQVMFLFSDNIFNSEVIVKVIDYTNSDGLYLKEYWLSSKFGIIAEFGDPPGIPIYSLSGAKIGGILYGTVSSIGEKVSNNVINDFSLYQNYPNPFNPTTIISWQLKVGTNVTLEIFDLLGNKVITLINNYEQPGYYKTRFDASNLSSGVYFYSLKTTENIITKKMVFIR